MTAKIRGFTLLEIMVVLAILSILVVMALPSNEGRYNRIRIEESLKLVDRFKSDVEAYYLVHQEFPATNDSANIPLPHQIIGNFLSETQLSDGALHLRLGNKISQQLQGQIISLRPVFVPGSEKAPISWICGHDTVPAGMVVAGENRTSVDIKYLPLSCR